MYEFGRLWVLSVYSTMCSWNCRRTYGEILSMPVLDFCSGWLYRSVSFCILFEFHFHLEVPNCGGFLDCGSCAQKEACAWCASESVCVTISEAFSKDCGGLVFDLPCPDSFVSGSRSLPLFTYIICRECGGWKLDRQGRSIVWWW